MNLFRAQLGGCLPIGRGNIPPERSHGRIGLEAHLGIVPRRVAAERKIARLRVIREAILGVPKGNAVGDNMVGGAFIRRVAAAQFEAVAVTLEWREAPSMFIVSCILNQVRKGVPVEPITPGNGILNRHGRLELPQIQPVVDIIPQSRSLEEVT